MYDATILDLKCILTWTVRDKLAGRGYNLLLVARSKEELNRTAKELMETSRQVWYACIFSACKWFLLYGIQMVIAIVDGVFSQGDGGGS